VSFEHDAHPAVANDFGYLVLAERARAAWLGG
jgi:hypothetical protein